MMYFIYNLTLKFLTLLLLPGWLLILIFIPRWRRRWRERLGFPSRKIAETFQTMPRPRIWFHAASVGEVSAIAPLARAFKERNPQVAIVVSCNTLTGREQARQLIPEASQLFIMPLDFPGVVRRVIRLIQPNLLAIAETELWPNLIRESKRAGIQLALVNGRLSEKSVKRYRWLRGLLVKMLGNFDLVVVQSEKDGERFVSLGANPQRLKIMGNVKADIQPITGVENLQKELRLNAGQPIWVAGSIRPGEDEIILDVFQRVQKEVPSAVLIFAPRHMERLREVERLFTQRRINFTFRSRVSQELFDFPVILLDTMGELSRAYGLGHVAFVGGSLAPFGGHNPLEPATLGVPVLFGPNMEHFSRIAELLLKSGGARTVLSADELATAVIALLQHPEEAKQKGKQARQAVIAFQGAAGHTVDLLQKLMLIKKWAAEVRQWRAESLQNSSLPPNKKDHDQFNSA